MPFSCVRLYAEQHAHEIGPVLYCNGGTGPVIHKYGSVLPGLRSKENPKTNRNVESVPVSLYRVLVCLVAHLQLQQPLHTDSEYLAVTFQANNHLQ